MVITVILNRSFSGFVTLVHCKVSFVTYLPTELARQKHSLAVEPDAGRLPIEKIILNYHCFMWYFFASSIYVWGVD